MTRRHLIPWTAAKIIEATGGRLLCGDLHRPFSGVSIDSRAISVDDVFVAITGNVHDGHAFVSQIVGLGGCGVVISRDKARQMPVEAWEKSAIVCVAVEDTTRALGDMAAYNRLRSRVSVAAITGSSGKTSTRRMISMVLAQQYDTLTAVGNFNNEIGVPLTLLGLTTDHQWAVLELGTNNPGEIARLAEICTPDIGVLTNIGPAHLQGLGSIEGVMQEKGDLLRSLGPEDKAILNADDRRVMQLARETKAEVTLFGLSRDAAVRAENISETGQTISFTLILAGERIAVRLNSTGGFMVSNALAAAAVGYQTGICGEAIKTGLEAFVPVSGRMNIKHMTNGVHLIDDTYNANPDSMKAAFTALNSLRRGARSILVLGDMFELGAEARTLHSEVGARAARSGASRLYICGKFAANLASGARDEGMQTADMFMGAQDEIVADLKKHLRPGDWVLVKGSRGMAMEKVVRQLEQWFENGQ